MHKPIVCPLNGHLEVVEIETTPVGTIVESCSRFASAMTCTRECARRMDVCEDTGTNELTERVLVLYADGSRGRPAAEAVATKLRAAGLDVELADADTRAVPPPEDYDALALVTPSPTARYGREITKYLREHADTLRTMPVTRMSPP